MGEPFWGVVEVMGHQRATGLVSETTFAGAAMVRVDIPTEPPTFELLGAGALFRVRPCTETYARNEVRYQTPLMLQTEVATEVPRIAARDPLDVNYADDDSTEGDRDDDPDEEPASTTDDRLLCAFCAEPVDGTDLDSPTTALHTDCAVPYHEREARRAADRLDATRTHCADCGALLDARDPEAPGTCAPGACDIPF